MVPASKGAAFEVVESELSFEVFVHPLSSPALLDDADELLVAHPTRQRREVELGTSAFLRQPLDDQPHRLALGDGHAIFVD